MSGVLRIAALGLAVLIVGRPVFGQATGTGDGSKTGDGSTPYTGLAQAPEANLFLGAATTSVPILVPPGRKSMTPQLALGYTSSGGVGPYGYGWDLNLPRLQRTTKHGVLSCNDASLRNQLVLTLPGASVECTLQGDGSCKPHVQAGFLRIQRSLTNETEFKVTDKSGIVYTFGGNGSAEGRPVVTTDFALNATFGGDNAVTGSTTMLGFDTTTSPCKYISTWWLRRAQDPDGNYIEYRYVRNGGMLYPHSIVYGGIASGLTPFYTLYFLWQARDDAAFNGLGGFAAFLNYRLLRINVIHGSNPSTGTLVRGYTFGYETPWSPSTPTGRLGRQNFLKTAGLLGANGTLLNNAAGFSAREMFIYHPKTYGFATAAQSFARPAVSAPVKQLRITGAQGTRRDVMDMNGDGYPDLIDVVLGNCVSGAATNYWNVYWGSAAGFAPTSTPWYLPSATVDCRIQRLINDGADATFSTADLTGDGIPDYIDARGGTTANQWDVYPGRYDAATGKWGFSMPT